MEVTIRQDTDLESILLADNYCFPGEPMDPEEAENFTWWTARVRSTREIAAYAALWIVSGEEMKLGFLCRSGVLPLARGNGLQKKLIRCRVSHARRKGCSTAISYTMYHNHPSSNSLIREGFTLYEPEYEYAGREVLYWRKDLDA